MGDELTETMLDTRRGGQGLCKTPDGTWVHVSFGAVRERHRFRPLGDLGTRLDSKHVLGGIFYSNSQIRSLLAEQYLDEGRDLDLSISGDQASRTLLDVRRRLDALPLDHEESPSAAVATSMNESRVTVPLTRLRHFYMTLRDLGKTARNGIATSLAASRRDVSLLEELFIDAVGHIARQYHPSRELPMTPASGRKPLDGATRAAMKIVEHLRDHHEVEAHPILEGAASWRFRYLSREVSPLRTPGARWADGLEATSSGSGGIDVLGVTDEEVPHLVVGEIKAKTDTDLLLALVQALTYTSELVGSETQLARVHHQYDLRTKPSVADIWLMYEPHEPGDTIAQDVARFVKAFMAQEHRDSRQWLRRIALVEVDAATNGIVFRERQATAAVSPEP